MADRMTITGRLRFDYEDGPAVEWSIGRPKTVSQLHRLIDEWAEYQDADSSDDADDGYPMLRYRGPEPHDVGGEDG